MARTTVTSSGMIGAAVALALAACGHELDPGVRATLPQPAVANADFGSETFAGVGGVTLYGRWWRPRGDVRAIVVVQHGLNDHGDRYAHLAETLVSHGYTVYAMDLRGHGRSAGPRVEIDRFDDWVDDEATWVSRIRDKEKGKPIFAYGHSAGGLIMTVYGERHATDLAGLIVDAPALGIDAPPLTVAVLQLIDQLGAPGHMMTQHDPDFARDPAVVADMGKDPLLAHGDGPTHTAVAVTDGIEEAWAGADQLTEPLLVFHGTVDKVTSPAASRDFVARAASTDKRHVVIEGAWHDMDHDPTRDQLEGDVVAWLDAHTGGAAIAAAARGPDHLRGEAGTSAIALEVGGAIGQLVGPDPNSATGGLAYQQLSMGELGAQASLGALWHGELDVRIRDGVGVDILPIGMAVRPWRAGQIALAVGLRAGWPGAWSDVSVPLRFSVDSPAGPTHVIARVTANFPWREPMNSTVAMFDEHRSIEAMLAIRFGGDHDYWSRTSAGSGPFVGATWSRSGNIDLWGIVFGIHLWGVN